MFDSLYIKSNQMQLFYWNVAYFIAPVYENNDLVLTKAAGVTKKDGLLECIIFVQCICTIDVGETMLCKKCDNIRPITMTS